ncbi:GMP synthase (glutamine-hydrolyzing) [Halorhabdus sp. SVX81]|uniref:type 1 glutamine amidotransferase n=1 Tax=Halorhabdus sp. SVX81 TaxID=2978283 RepID=UPI0023DBF6FB|nr:type 1 glutamine amidotransferase [Halorhabdus sp. SVX81]WEL17138.1 GMP synthase (glutamine-hydrolyzing) [Halorhabdus sp. SVX81]
MDRPRLALLNAAQEAADTRRNFERELDADLDVFHCPSGELPDGFQYDGFVITGSSASVYWDREWIGELKMWVGDAIRAGLPALGVCFGHQLLADVMGGNVKSMGEYELGYRTVTHDGENRLLDGIDETMTVFMSHSDHVTDEPPGATVFAENEYGIQSFRKGRVFAVQFHPEYDMETAELITRGKADEIPKERIETVLAGIHEENYAAAQHAKTLFDNFLAVVKDVQRKRIDATNSG